VRCMTAMSGLDTALFRFGVPKRWTGAGIVEASRSKTTRASHRAGERTSLCGLTSSYPIVTGRSWTSKHAFRQRPDGCVARTLSGRTTRRKPLRKTLAREGHPFTSSLP
jgi:hypothetical protein